MSNHKTGCLVCGKNIKYSDSPKKLPCEMCGLEFEATVFCEEGHFICDACHRQAGYEFITGYALKTESKNPVAIAIEIMKHKFINMHGPEHHYLVPAALLAAYKNSGGSIDLEKLLGLAAQRAQNVPGGICGFWGCCGGAVGSGIFISLITGATPLSVGEWSLANKMTSLSLEAVSRQGGPRCCKRNSFLPMLTAVDFVKKHLQITMETAKEIKCFFFNINPSCKKEKCLFYPKIKK